MRPVFDGHNDAITREDHALLVSGRPEGHLDLPRMNQAGLRGAIFAVCAPSEQGRGNPLPRDDGVIEFELAAEVPHREAAAFATAAASRLLTLERDGHVRIARTITDLDAAAAGDGPPAAVLHFEGAEAIDPDLESLVLWHSVGLRSLGPVWSRPSRFAHGVPFISPASPDTGPGLTRAGRELIKRCAELGILVDLSHLNEAGFWDIAGLEAGPLVASHAAAHRLCATTRNLTDEQLDAIGTTNGLVGIVFAVPFLRSDFSEDPDTPVELIAEHAVYIAERIGVEHVALGSDFDGATIPAGVGGVDGMPRVLDALADAGFSEAELDQIAWGNWRRVLDAWWN